MMTMTRLAVLATDWVAGRRDVDHDWMNVLTKSRIRS